jgi:hypothetical protein
LARHFVFRKEGGLVEPGRWITIAAFAAADHGDFSGSKKGSKAVDDDGGGAEGYSNSCCSIGWTPGGDEKIVENNEKTEHG